MGLREEHRVQTIGTAILQQAEAQSRDIINQVNLQREKELADFTALMQRQMKEELARAAEKTKKDTLSGIARAEQEAYHTLLRRRDALTQQVFADVAARLRDFSATDAYPAWLAQQLRDTCSPSEEWQGGSLYLRPADMGLATGLERLLPRCRVAVDSHIQLGGFILENAAGTRRMDQTLECRLAGQRAWFLQSCGLKVQ